MIQLVRALSISSVILMGSCITCYAAEENTPTSEKEVVQTQEVYKIRIGAYKNANNASVTNLSNLGGTIYTEDAGNGITRVLLGDYATKDDAEDILDEVHERGYEDAYIVKGEAVAALVQPATHTIATPAPAPAPAPAPTLAVSPAPAPAPATPAMAEAGTVITTETAYLIQIGSFKKPNYEKQLSDVGDYGSLYTTIKKGKSTKVFLGIYESKEDAEKVLKLAKSSGYGSAFIKTAEFKEVNKQFKLAK